MEVIPLLTHSIKSPCAPGFTHQGALQVESLGVLTQQHHVLLQVVQAAVFMAADPLLMEGRREQRKAAVRQRLNHTNITLFFLLSQHEEQRGVTLYPYLDLSEVHWFANQLIVLGQLLARRQLDEDFTELSAITAKTRKHKV